MATFSSTSPFNNQARDNVLTYQLNHEVGAYIEVVPNNNGFLVQLFSKDGTKLSEQQININIPEPVADVHLQSVTLKPEDRGGFLVFTLNDEAQTKITCDFSAFYADLLNKQNRLTTGPGLIINDDDHSTINIAPGFSSCLGYEEVISEAHID